MRKLAFLWEVIRRVWQAYWRDECLILSAAISFCAIFSVIPFFFLLFVFWGIFVGSSDLLYTQIVQFARTLAPDIGYEVLEDIRTVVEHRSALGWVGVFFLIWIFDVVFYSIAHAFDRIFGAGKRRRYYRMKIASFAGLLMTCVVVYSFIQLAVLATAIRNTSLMVGGIDLSFYVAKSLSFSYLVYVFLIILFTVMFRIMPTTQIRFPFALVGGVIFVNLWYVAKIAFHWYVENIAVFNIVYGTLGTLIIVVLWIYYSANILLISAEFISVGQDLWEKRTLDKAGTGG